MLDNHAILDLLQGSPSSKSQWLVVGIMITMISLPLLDLTWACVFPLPMLIALPRIAQLLVLVAKALSLLALIAPPLVVMVLPTMSSSSPVDLSLNIYT